MNNITEEVTFTNITEEAILNLERLLLYKDEICLLW